MWEKKFAAVLREQFAVIKSANPRFSMRAFAKKLDLSIGTMSDLLNDKATITADRAAKVLNELKVGARERNELLLMMNKQPIIDKKDLPDDLYAMITDWQNRMILFSFDLEEPNRDVTVLSKKLRMSVSDINEIIKGFVSKGLLSRDQDGKISRNQEIWASSDGRPNKSLINLHTSSLKMSLEVFPTIPTEKRDVSTINFAGCPEKLDEVRKEIRKFYEKVLVIMESGPRTEVYQFSMQLLPLAYHEGEK